jgi:hypothetical protein
MCLLLLLLLLLLWGNGSVDPYVPDMNSQFHLPTALPQEENAPNSCWARD